MIKWLTITEGAGLTAGAVDIGAGAGDTMVFVSVSETYDLSTKANKMTLIGVHTPSKNIIQKTYPGLCMNSKYCRIVKQDVVLACASTMPFSADIVGTGADDISPSDVFNPILYKAVSNESMSTLEARLSGLNLFQQGLALHGESIEADNSNVTGLSDEFNVYYSLLSNRDGFKTASPQQGLSMKGLVPLVFEKYYNFGTNYNGSILNQHDVIPTESIANNAHTIGLRQVQGMRGKAHPMPRFNTTYLTGIGTGSAGVNYVKNGMGDGNPNNSQIEMPEIMPVYTALIVMPPSKLHALFYRLVVRTTLEFTEVRPIQEIASFQSLSTDYAPIVYQSDYADQSKLMTVTEGMVDVKDGEIQKIMEGA